MLVVDASVLAVALTDDGRDGDRARTRLRGEHLAAPELIDLEVTSVLRGGSREAISMYVEPSSPWLILRTYRCKEHPTARS